MLDQITLDSTVVVPILSHSSQVNKSLELHRHIRAAVTGDEATKERRKRERERESKQASLA